MALVIIITGPQQISSKFVLIPFLLQFQFPYILNIIQSVVFYNLRSKYFALSANVRGQQVNVVEATEMGNSQWNAIWLTTNCWNVLRFIYLCLCLENGWINLNDHQIIIPIDYILLRILEYILLNLTLIFSFSIVSEWKILDCRNHPNTLIGPITVQNNLSFLIKKHQAHDRKTAFATS